MADSQPTSGFEPVARRVLADIDFNRLALKHEIEPDAVEHVGEGRPEAEFTPVIAQSGKPVDEDHPDTTHRRDMTSILDVPSHIAEVHQRRYPRIVYSLIHLADFGGHDALDAGRQR